METWRHADTPHQNPSRPNESRTNPAITPKPTTRIPPVTTTAPPASQESNASVQSNEGGVVFQPHSSRSSIVSSQYTSNTDLTSPSSSVESVALYDGAVDGAPKWQYARVKTPERGVPSAFSNEEDAALFSPMSIITSPAASNGTKRTASGHVKNAPSLPSTPLAPGFDRHGGRRSRQASVSSTGSRASELAAHLKTRLGYAMAKVQHGWEHKSLVEVEQLAANRLSPNSSNSPFFDGRRSYPNRAYGSVNQDPYSRESLDHTSPPPSKRHSANYTSYLRSLHHYTPTSSQAPQLQPAVDIRPTSGYRQVHPAPNKHFNHAMSPPRTPINDPPRRPPTIRTGTQTAEAERDAVQALFQLGSPQGSQFFGSHANSLAASSQTSPLRSEFSTPRKADYICTDSSGVVQSAEADGRPRPPEAQ